MMELIITFGIGVLGLSLGSFVNALVWRLYMQKKISSGKKQTSSKYSIVSGRSMCPDCKHELVWYDLLPLISWLILGGKCRYCKKSISWQYPVVELITAILFVVSYIFWPYDFGGIISYTIFGLWLGFVVVSLALSVYDLRWMILPNRLVYALGIFSAAIVVALSIESGQVRPLIDGLIGAGLVGGGFWALYQISAGRWIGGGDVRLGFVLGALLGWQLAVLGVTLAAYIGLAVIVALIIMRRFHRKMHLPFGPMLLAGTYIAFLFGNMLIDVYLRLLGT